LSSPPKKLPESRESLSSIKVKSIDLIESESEKGDKKIEADLTDYYLLAAASEME